MSAIHKIFPELNVEACLFQGLAHSFAPHFHNASLAGMLLTGQREFHYGCKTEIMTTGDLILLNPGVPHSCLNSEPCAWLGLHLYGTTQVFDAIFIRNSDLKPLFTELARRLAAGADISAITQAKALLIHIQRILAERKREKLRENDKFFLSDRLKKNFDRAISLEEMCAFAGIPKFRLLRQFKKETGLTPYRYYENSRLLAAQIKLRGNLSLADCALSCGYCDQSHFNRHFKAIYGITPGAYRRACREALC